MHHINNLNDLYIESKDIFPGIKNISDKINLLFDRIGITYDNEFLSIEYNKNKKYFSGSNNGISYNKWLLFCSNCFGPEETVPVVKVIDRVSPFDGTQFQTTKIIFKEMNAFLLDKIKIFFNAEICITFILDIHQNLLSEENSSIELFIKLILNNLRHVNKRCYVKNKPELVFETNIYSGFSLTNYHIAMDDNNEPINYLDFSIYPLSILIFANIFDSEYNKALYQLIEYLPYINDKEMIMENLKNNTENDFYITSDHKQNIIYDYSQIFDKLEPIMKILGIKLIKPNIYADVKY